MSPLRSRLPTACLSVSSRQDYYAAIKDDPSLHVKLTGSWETVVGEQDTFCA